MYTIVDKAVELYDLEVSMNNSGAEFESMLDEELACWYGDDEYDECYGDGEYDSEYDKGENE